MSIFRKLFGPSRAEVWRQLSEQIGARYEESGFFGAGDEVVSRVGDWEIVLDTYTVSNGKSSTTYTRMRAPFLNREHFRFCIYRESIFSPLGKIFGMQDIEVGDPFFDDAFVIQSSDEQRVKALLASERIRGLMQEQPSFRLEVKDKDGFGSGFGEDVDVLQFHVVGVIKDLPRLEGLFALYAEVLEEVCAWGRRAGRAGAESALPSGTPPSVREAFAAVERSLGSFTGRPERVGDAVEARLCLQSPTELRGQLAVSLPVLPEDRCDVQLEAALPWAPGLGEATVRPKTGVAGHARALFEKGTGVPELDDACVVQSSEALLPLVRALAPSEARLAALEAEVRYADGRLTLRREAAPSREVEALCRAALELWRAAAAHLASGRSAGR